jgi:hypothetical protein
LTVLANMKDADGEPIYIEAVDLIVGPALEQVALNILNATEIRTTAAAQGGASNVEIMVANWLRNRVRLNVDPYVASIATSNANTSWWLAAAATSERPAFAFDTLRGYEEPQLFMKSPNAVRVGGGAVEPMQGSFENDGVDYKVRLFAGASPLDPKATVASNGTGS